jgi:hypothetical protein
MSNPAPNSKPPPAPPPNYAPLPALLSYLIPGLGQIFQGRVGKGLLFLFCIYGLFFYGMWLGDWSNVFIPDVTQNAPVKMSPTFTNLYTRPQYLGQFWVGVAAWPAILQYRSKDPLPVLGDFQRTPPETKLNELQNTTDKTWDLAWVYTVIAGVLNIMVIYDAWAGPAFVAGIQGKPTNEETGAKNAPATRR